MDTILLALALGAAFGFTLDRMGATNPDFIIGMLRLSDLHLMKTILAAIGIASVGLFGGLLLGVIDVGNMSVKAIYPGVIIGGALLGIGFAISGYCPGTGVTAAATGRSDALVFVLGGLAGAFAYMISFPEWKDAGLLETWLGGKATLGDITASSYPPVMSGVSGEWIGIGIGAGLILLAVVLPKSLRGRPLSHLTEPDGRTT
ncbi:MAG: YeeE/YedE thiosulfate transporter family protein [Pseudomonadota bacterium]